MKTETFEEYQKRNGVVTILSPRAQKPLEQKDFTPRYILRDRKLAEKRKADEQSRKDHHD